MAKLFLIQGHTNGKKYKDKGACNEAGVCESDITRPIVLSVGYELQNHIYTDTLDFSLSLSEKIQSLNKETNKDDIIIELHLDSSSSRKEKGAMCYYYGGSDTSKHKAQAIIDTYCEYTGIKNNGVRPDTSSPHGRLGIIRDTKAMAFILELGSINNDVKVVKEHGAEGVILAIKRLFGIQVQETEQNHVQVNTEHKNDIVGTGAIKINGKMYVIDVREV